MKAQLVFDEIVTVGDLKGQHYRFMLDDKSLVDASFDIKPDTNTFLEKSVIENALRSKHSVTEIVWTLKP